MPIDKKIRLRMPKSFISESLNNVNRIVAEDRGISMEVGNIASAVAKKIVSMANSTEPYRDSITGKKYRAGFFSYDTLWDVGLNIKWIITYHDSRKGEPIPKTVSSFNAVTKTATINAIAVNGTIDLAGMKETIQHELFHAFEMHKKDNRILSNEYYNHAFKRAGAIDERKYPVLFGINLIIYLSFEFEQRAYYNGAYKKLISSDDGVNNFDNAIQETNFFRLYNMVRDLYPKLKELQGEELHMAMKELEYYNLTWDEFLQLTKELLDSLLVKLGRLKSKVMDDYETRNVMYREPQPHNYFKIYENNSLGLSGWRYFMLKRFQEVLNGKTII